MFLFEAKLFPPCEAGGAVPVMYLSLGFERRLKVGFRVNVKTLVTGPAPTTALHYVHGVLSLSRGSGLTPVTEC